MNTMNVRIVLSSLLASLGSVISLAQTAAQSEPAPVYPEVPFVATPENVVDRMLDVAKVKKRDVVYDLGSGDGRIVIAAAKRGARAVGVDINPERIQEGLTNAKTAGVTERTKFINQDLFKVDLSEATVVTMYLLPSVNQRLRPKLLRELAPGTRIVSHAFDMGDWKPEKTVEANGNMVYYWVVPERDEALKMAAAFEKEASEGGGGGAH